MPARPGAVILACALCPARVRAARFSAFPGGHSAPEGKRSTRHGPAVRLSSHQRPSTSASAAWRSPPRGVHEPPPLPCYTQCDGHGRGAPVRAFPGTHSPTRETPPKECLRSSGSAVTPRALRSCGDVHTCTEALCASRLTARLSADRELPAAPRVSSKSNRSHRRQHPHSLPCSGLCGCGLARPYFSHVVLGGLSENLVSLDRWG